MPKPGKPLFTRTTPIKRDPNYSPREAKLLDVSDPERPIRTRLRFRLAHYARKAVHADNFGTRLEYALEQLERMDRYVTGRKGLDEFDAAMRALKMALGADHALANEHLPAFVTPDKGDLWQDIADIMDIDRHTAKGYALSYLYGGSSSQLSEEARKILDDVGYNRKER